PARPAPVRDLRALVRRASRVRRRSALRRQDERFHLWNPGRDLVVTEGAMLIAGDIGGTKTDLGIYSSEGGPHSPLAQGEGKSGDYPSLQAIVSEFLGKVKMPVTAACFDVAGPVIDGSVKTTNLPWTMDERTLARELNLRSVRLINDLEAVARSVP